jgi:hypothetical protein
VTFEDRRACSGSPRTGVSLGDSTLALYDLRPDESTQLWGRPYQSPRTHLMALRVDDLEAAKDSLLGAGIALTRADESTIILNPAATGGVQTALFDRLLPGDPRLT